MWVLRYFFLVLFGQVWIQAGATATHCIDYVNTTTAVILSRRFGSVDCITGDAVLTGQYMTLGELSIEAFL